MQTRKLVLLTVPVILIVLLVLTLVLTMSFTSTNSGNTPVSDEQAAVEAAPQAETPNVISPESAEMPAQENAGDGSDKPRVIYENQE